MSTEQRAVIQGEREARHESEQSFQEFLRSDNPNRLSSGICHAIVWDDARVFYLTAIAAAIAEAVQRERKVCIAELEWVIDNAGGNKDDSFSDDLLWGIRALTRDLPPKFLPPTEQIRARLKPQEGTNAA